MRRGGGRWCNKTSEPPRYRTGSLLESRRGARWLGVAVCGHLLPGSSTLADLVLLVFENCQRLLDSTVKNVEVKEVQLDEIWSFVEMKERTRAARGKSPVEFGDSWTFYGISENKLILAHQVGQRDSDACWAFLMKMKAAIGTGRLQLTTDGLALYRQNVPFAFQSQVDFAVLIKNYGSTQETTRYSPAKITNIEKLPMFGDCDEDKISTSYIERFNLTVRMSQRRFTRLTNGHGKSLRHHSAMQALFVAWYNFARKHEALKGNTPAMAAGLRNHVWTTRGTNREGGEMRFRWFRFSVTSLLVLMLLVSNACMGWRVYRNIQHARLLRQLETAVRERDTALQNWKFAGNDRFSGTHDATKEAACRGQYFISRTAVETALKRLGVYKSPPQNN